jgi:branched-subunit amino acid transport protein
MTATLVMLGLAAGTYGLKAAGPLVLGDRPLPTAVHRLAQLMPAALLAALVAVSTLAHQKHLALDARLVGLAAAALALWRRAPFAVVVAAAVAATAATRLAAG